MEPSPRYRPLSDVAAPGNGCGAVGSVRLNTDVKSVIERTIFAVSGWAAVLLARILL